MKSNACAGGLVVVDGEFRRTGRGVWVIVALLMTPGCGGEEGGATVTGMVTYKDQPVTQGSISFIPSGGSSAWARIGQDGRYHLQNAKRTERIEPGAYVVVIVAGARDLVSEGPVEELPVPVEVTSRATTPLSYEVKPGANTIDVNLDEVVSRPGRPAAKPSGGSRGAG
jgi:hypothetical protein